MTNQFTVQGREFFAKYTFRQIADNPQIEIGLRNEADRGLQQKDTLAELTTEPDTATQYSRFQGRMLSNGSVQRTTAGVVQYEYAFETINFELQSLTGSSVVIDSYFLAAQFQSTEFDDTQPQLRLIYSESLDQEYDLTELDILRITNHGVTYGR